DEFGAQRAVGPADHPVRTHGRRVRAAHRRHAAVGERGDRLHRADRPGIAHGAAGAERGRGAPARRRRAAARAGRRRRRAAAARADGLDARLRRPAADGGFHRRGQRDAAALRAGRGRRHADHAADRALAAAGDLQLHHAAAPGDPGGRGRADRGPAVKRGRLVVVLAMLVSCLPAGQLARAQDSGLPELLTLPELLRLVAARSPRLAVERVGIDAAQAERTTAGALPNPTISYGRSRPSGGAPNSVIDGTRQQQAGIDLPVLIAGQRGARVEAAEQGVLGARARVDLAASELALRAAELHAGLQAAQEKGVVLGEAQGEFEHAAALISGRLESGMASRYDLARVEIEVANIAVRLAEARADAAEKSAAIAALLGAPGWRPRAAGVLRPGTQQGGGSAGLPALAGNPQIIAARRDEDTARAAVRRAELERWPVPTLSLSRTWTSEPFGAANFFGFS